MSFEDLEWGEASPKHFNVTQTTTPSSSKAVVTGVFKINTAVASFVRLHNSLTTPKDTVHLRHKLHKSRLQIRQLVKETLAKLKEASEVDEHTEVGDAKRIANARLAKDFESVVREFEKAQQLAAEKELGFAPFVPEEVLPSRQVILLDNEIAFNQATIEERDQGIKEIRQQIGEVNQIFKDLAVLVHEQGTVIDNVSSNIQNTHSATTQATFQITEASNTQKSISSMSCLLLVIFGIILFIVVIVAVS
ncbi:syntaxin-22-like isoform X1 [Apium graveolens]|uniref:syntaxin-22-like isoform X1 n=1 Tax=Apium graveolens TaxID=4045 RepID=UPI003D797016